MKGIDISYAQGVFNWERAVETGVSFAMLKSSQGRLEYRDDSGAFEDPRFAWNAKECARLGIPFGAYHFLTCRSDGEAREEAEYFCSVIRPYAGQMSLWAAVDLESRHLPNDKETLTRYVKIFTDIVAANGFRPMIYTNTDWIRNRINLDTTVPLWLALWNSTEEYARAYNPAIWQYGLDTSFAQAVDGDLIFEEIEEETPEKKQEEEAPKVRRYPSWERFDAEEQGIEDGEGEIFFRKRGILQAQFAAWSYFKSAEEEHLREDVGDAEITVIPITYNGGRVGLVVDAEPKAGAGYPSVSANIPARRTTVTFDRNGKNITDAIMPFLVSLTVTDADADEADDLQFTLAGGDIATNEKFVDFFTEDAEYPIGVTIVKQTGAPDGTFTQETLNCGAFYVDEVSETIAPCRVTVKATSIALTEEVKKKKSRSWAENGQVSLLQIAQEVADGLDLRLEDQGTRAAGILYGNTLIQHRQTDIDFLSTQCAAADITVKLSNGQLILMESQRDAMANAVIITPQDCSAVQFNSGSQLREYSMVTVSYTDTNGRLVYGIARDPDVKGGKTTTVYIKVGSNAEAKKIAEDILRSYNRYVFTASLTMPGSVKMAAGNSVMLDGFGKRDGRYTITEAKHKIGTGGYTTTVELKESEENARVE